jgi:hypothetical protein
MRAKNYWVLALFIGLLFTVASLLSAIVTATGAFGNDPGKGVNRIDFVWAAAGLVIAVFSFYRIQFLKRD